MRTLPLAEYQLNQGDKVDSCEDQKDSELEPCTVVGCDCAEPCSVSGTDHTKQVEKPFVHGGIAQERKCAKEPRYEAALSRQREADADGNAAADLTRRASPIAIAPSPPL